MDFFCEKLFLVLALSAKATHSFPYKIAVGYLFFL